MTGSIGSIILLIIIIGCVIYWLMLRKQINDEENDRIEPHIDSSFSEFSQKSLLQDNDHDDYHDDIDDVVEFETSAQSTNDKMTAKEEISTTENVVENTEPEPTKKGFFARLKESFSSESESIKKPHNHLHGRPEVTETIALILMAPEDQPYLGQEILEVGEELKLMIGGEGYLQQIVTTYLGDEPMFSIAHLLHPGNFNDPEILDKEIPGLVFFAQLPGPDPQMNTIHAMMQAAAIYGQELGGTLLDSKQRSVDSDYIKDLIEDCHEDEQKAWIQYRAQH